MAHQLQLSTPTIRQFLAIAYHPLDTDAPPLLPSSDQIPNGLNFLLTVSQWESTQIKLLTPDQCHAALTVENPSYAKLNITQRPSWVRNPKSYSEDAVSLLVVAFEDLDGSLAHELLKNRVLYVFGHCTTLKKWKQRPTAHCPLPDNALALEPDTSDMPDMGALLHKLAEVTHSLQ